MNLKCEAGSSGTFKTFSTALRFETIASCSSNLAINPKTILERTFDHLLTETSQQSILLSDLISNSDTSNCPISQVIAYSGVDHTVAQPAVAIDYDPDTGLITYSCNPEHTWTLSLKFEVTNAG